MSVEIKDRKKSVEYLRLALNMAEIAIDYEHCELVQEMQNEIDNLGGKFTIDDSINIKHEWSKRWEAYYKEQNKA